MVKNRIFNALTLFFTSIIVFAILLTLLATGIINEYYGHILILAGINTIIALGLNLITGFTGQLALGQAGFMMVGAYTTAILMMKLNLPLFLAVLGGGIISALFGMVIGFPTLRLRGDYLAITTLGFGEIIRVLINYFEGLTGGASGLKGIPPYHDDYWMNHLLSFVWVFWFLVAAIVLVSNLINSSTGRAIISIREDEIASNSMGINVSYYKMFAFTLTAFLAGIGGGLYALFQQYLTPSGAGFMYSVYFVVYVVFGGLGSITGTIIGTVFLTFLQEVLSFIGDFRLVIFGLLLIVMMIFWPKGVMGTNEFSITTFVKKLISGRSKSGNVNKSTVSLDKKQQKGQGVN